MSNPKQRRIVLIDHRFQLTLAGLFVLVQVVLTGGFALVLYVFLRSELQAGLASAHAAYRSLAQMLMPIILVLSGFSLAISTLCVTVFVLLLTRRIVGPLYRFKAVLDELGARRIPAHARLHPKDQLQGLSPSFVRAVDTLEEDLNTLKDAADALRAAHAVGDLAAQEPAIATLERVMDSWARRSAPSK